MIPHWVQNLKIQWMLVDRAIEKYEMHLKKHMTRKRGVCFCCGCTDKKACLDRCSWANPENTFCTSCLKLIQVTKNNPLNIFPEYWPEGMTEGRFKLK
jgi:hypothetical protein